MVIQYAQEGTQPCGTLLALCGSSTQTQVIAALRSVGAPDRVATKSLLDRGCSTSDYPQAQRCELGYILGQPVSECVCAQAEYAGARSPHG